MQFISNLCYTLTLSIYFGAFPVSGGTLPALILVNVGETYELVDFENLKNFESSKLILLACLLDYESNSNSLTGNSLYIERIHRHVSKVKDIGICKKRFSPSVTHNEDLHVYSFGYEIFISDEQFQQIVIWDDMESPYDSQFGNLIGKIVKIKDPNFFWYTVMLAHYKDNQPLRIVHQVSKNQYSENFKNCHNFNLGRKYFANQNLERVYDKDFQTAALSYYISPDLTVEDIKEMYLVEQQLTPIDDFDSYGKRMVTCSYLNVAPMWKRIHNGSWPEIEELIQIVSKFVPLVVSTGTSRILELTKYVLPLPTEQLFLDKTPVPEFFWKFVTYSLVGRNQVTYRYGVVIVTYNYIDSNHEMVCADNVCMLFGWNAKKKYGNEFTYCCEVNEGVLNKLGINEVLPIKVLDLNRVDMQIDEFGEVIKTININENRIGGTMEQLSVG